MLIDAQQNEKGLDGSIKALHQTACPALHPMLSLTKQSYLSSSAVPGRWWAESFGV